MTTSLLRTMFACIILTQLAPTALAAGKFSFGLVAHGISRVEEGAILRNALDDIEAEKLAFVVVNGLKANDEPCTDEIYRSRKIVLQNAPAPVILSVAASDWADCRTEIGKSDALAKLNKIRELFFPDSLSLGNTKIALTRQSTITKFRGFAENARWVVGGIMFVTVNLPDDNNHYLPDAGRNSEFEDRLVANRNWLNRVFTLAQREKLNAVVLFSDANPLTPPDAVVRRDGYAETRKLILGLAARFPGKLLIVHGKSNEEAATPRIRWRDNIGELGVPPGWMRFTVNPSGAEVFSVEAPLPPAANNRK